MPSNFICYNSYKISIFNYILSLYRMSVGVHKQFFQAFIAKIEKKNKINHFFALLQQHLFSIFTNWDSFGCFFDNYLFYVN